LTLFVQNFHVSKHAFFGFRAMNFWQVVPMTFSSGSAKANIASGYPFTRDILFGEAITKGEMLVKVPQ
jgi:hypothetical protein